jgi:hypothetical protein
MTNRKNRWAGGYMEFIKYVGGNACSLAAREVTKKENVIFLG